MNSLIPSHWQGRFRLRRVSGAFGFLILALLLSGLLSVQLHAAPRPTVAFWYAAQPPISELSQFDWVVLEPAHVSAADIGALRRQGAGAFAYLSIGELDRYQSEQAPGLVEAAATPIRNENWDSQVMDLANPAWRAYLIEQARLRQSEGYAGLFLDTLDSFALLPAEAREGQATALTSLLRELSVKFPDLRLIFNRGFEVLADLEGVPAAVAVESLRAGWDPSIREYRQVPDEDRAWLDGRLAPLVAAGVPIIAIEYLPPERREEARARVVRSVRGAQHRLYPAQPVPGAKLFRLRIHAFPTVLRTAGPAAPQSGGG